jgi:hypothetical protein
MNCSSSKEKAKVSLGVFSSVSFYKEIEKSRRGWERLVLLDSMGVF